MRVAVRRTNQARKRRVVRPARSGRTSSNPDQAEAILQLQRTIGNRAVGWNLQSRRNRSSASTPLDRDTTANSFERDLRPVENTNRAIAGRSAAGMRGHSRATGLAESKRGPAAVSAGLEDERLAVGPDLFSPEQRKTDLRKWKPVDLPSPTPHEYASIPKTPVYGGFGTGASGGVIAGDGRDEGSLTAPAREAEARAHLAEIQEQYKADRADAEAQFEDQKAQAHNEVQVKRKHTEVERDNKEVEAREQREQREQAAYAESEQRKADINAQGEAKKDAARAENEAKKQATQERGAADIEAEETRGDSEKAAVLGTGKQQYDEERSRGKSERKQIRAEGRRAADDRKLEGRRERNRIEADARSKKSQGLLGKVASEISSAFNSLMGKARSVWRRAKSEAKGIWKKAKGRAKKLWNTAKKKARQLWKAAKKKAKEIAAKVLEVVNRIRAAVRAAITFLVNELANAIKSILDWVRMKITMVALWLVNKLIELVTWLRRKISEITHWLIEQIRKLAQWLTEKLRAAGQWLREKLAELIKALKRLKHKLEDGVVPTGKKKGKKKTIRVPWNVTIFKQKNFPKKLLEKEASVPLIEWPIIVEIPHLGIFIFDAEASAKVQVDMIASFGAATIDDISVLLGEDDDEAVVQASQSGLPSRAITGKGTLNFPASITGYLKTDGRTTAKVFNIPSTLQSNLAIGLESQGALAGSQHIGVPVAITFTNKQIRVHAKPKRTLKLSFTGWLNAFVELLVGIGLKPEKPEKPEKKKPRLPLPRPSSPKPEDPDKPPRPKIPAPAKQKVWRKIWNLAGVTLNKIWEIEKTWDIIIERGAEKKVDVKWPEPGGPIAAILRALKDAARTQTYKDEDGPGPGGPEPQDDKRYEEAAKTKPGDILDIRRGQCSATGWAGRSAFCTAVHPDASPPYITYKGRRLPSGHFRGGVGPKEVHPRFDRYGTKWMRAQVGTQSHHIAPKGQFARHAAFKKSGLSIDGKENRVDLYCHFSDHSPEYRAVVEKHLDRVVWRWEKDGGSKEELKAMVIAELESIRKEICSGHLRLYPTKEVWCD